MMLRYSAATLRSLTGSLDYNTIYHGSSCVVCTETCTAACKLTAAILPQHVSFPQHDGMSTQQYIALTQHVSLSAPRHIDKLVPKHAMQLRKTSVPVAETVSRRIDPELTELEEDSIPRSATSALWQSTHPIRTKIDALCRKLWAKSSYDSGGIVLAPWSKALITFTQQL